MKEIKLFPYQQNALDCIESDPSHSQLISMPTGTGKTITFLNLAKQKNKRCLILVHREELLKQTYDKAKLCGYEEENLALVTSEKKEEFKKLTIAMVPTLIRNLDLYNPDSIEMVIIDEAHHATAASYMNILKYFKVFEEKKLIFGFTATPLRGDKSMLSDIFLSHSFKMTLSEATKEGYICPVYGLRVEIDKSLSEIDTIQGDYDIKQLDKVINCPEVNKIIVERCDLIRKHPGIIFCTSVNHAIELARLLREKKKKAISVSHLTSKKNLERIYRMLRKGSIDFITNAVKLSEGFDYPPIQSIIVARPTRSPVLYKQMIGRGLRKSEGKEDCIVIEFTGSDPKMMQWEEIDENAQFHSFSEKKRITEKEAKVKIQHSFGLNVNVLDVRLSQFQFYECLIQRVVRYKKDFLFMPANNRFIISRIIEAPGQVRGYDKNCNLVMWHCIWNKEFEDYYLWNSGILYYDFLGHPIKDMEKIFKFYIGKQPLGKWYPSEEDKMTFRQKKLLPNVNVSARKAEFMIEDRYYKNLIDSDWINGKYADYNSVEKV